MQATRLRAFGFAFALGAALVAPGTAAAQEDSDGDGVSDLVDPFPCDGSRAAVTFFPGETTSALLLFEDQWPSSSDTDFNDVALRVHYRAERDRFGDVVSLLASFDPVALGGEFDNGLGLVLPTSAAGVTVERRVGAGAWGSLTPEAAANPTVVLSSNLRELFASTPGRINSRQGVARISGQTLQVRFTFATPAALSMLVAPFDVFIFRAGISPRHEIHLPDYAGTALFDTSLLNSSQDRSTPTRRFVTGPGVPAALNLMTSTRYPLEAVLISQIFPNIVPFANSGGSSNKDFYEVGVVPGHGHDIPASAIVAPGVDTTCLPCQAGTFTYSTAGEVTLTPGGCNRVAVRLWGGGGGGGGSDHGGGRNGGSGGGGAYVAATFPVPAGSSVVLRVGGGGKGGGSSHFGQTASGGDGFGGASGGGGGTGYSSGSGAGGGAATVLYVGSTLKAVAGGGGGGGGAGAGIAGNCASCGTGRAVGGGGQPGTSVAGMTLSNGVLGPNNGCDGGGPGGGGGGYPGGNRGWFSNGDCGHDGGFGGGSFADADAVSPVITAGSGTTPGNIAAGWVSGRGSGGGGSGNQSAPGGDGGAGMAIVTLSRVTP
jgi:LruC domain-containing protein